MLPELHDGARFFSPKNNFNNLIPLIIVTLIPQILHIRSPVLHFEPESVVNIVDVELIVLRIEKLLENDSLVGSHHEVLSTNEGRKQPQVLCRHVPLGLACF